MIFWRAKAEEVARQSVSGTALFLSALGVAFIREKAAEFGTTPEVIEVIQAYGYLAGGLSPDTSGTS